jgi:hypothetical protein
VAAGALPVTSPQTGLAFDVKAVPVGGTVTLNGAVPPTDPSDCASNPLWPKAWVNLVETTLGYKWSFAVPCNSANFAFSGVVFPGVYKVTISEDFSNDEGYLIDAALPITTATTQLVLDKKNVAVHGTVTLNGSLPTDDPACAGNPTSSKASVYFTETTLGYAFRFDVPCSSANYEWSGLVFPGTYKVSLSGSYSNLPGAIVYPAMPIMSAMPNLALNVNAFNVAGNITVNGAVPMDSCGTPANPAATASVVFTETTSGIVTSRDLLCSDNYHFSLPVVPGTYRVGVSAWKYGPHPDPVGPQDLLQDTAVIKDALAVSAAVTGLALDVRTYAVGGTVTLNGAIPQDGVDCTAVPTGTKATVYFDEPELGYHEQFAVPCSSASYAYAGYSLPGVYQVSVVGDGFSSPPSSSNLPLRKTVIVPRLAVP